MRANFKFIKRLILFLISAGCCSVTMAQTSNHFELTFSKSFSNGQPNQVAYINFPNVHLYGYFEVTITGGYNNQLNRGKLTKRYTIIRSIGGFFTQSNEVLSASGELASQWKLGDFDNSNSQIPIYHLVGTGNDIVVRIEGELIHPESIATINSSLNVSDPTILPNKEERDYMSIMQDRVGIGTSSPKYTLDVIGTIRSREVKVDLNGADFVFENGYNLRPLTEVEAFVKTNKHLPDVAPASEMQANGVSIGDMNAKLLQKVEELTLYLIEKDKKISILERKLDKVDEQIESLKVALAARKK